MNKQDRFRRIALGGRPLAVAFPDRSSNRAVVVNHLNDAIQVVDISSGTLVRTIPLGSPLQKSPARQGEEMFYDARRSHNQWFSCHTCHVDGNTCGLNFDTLNDASYGTPKLTPPLYNVTRTGPWTWHGWQKDLAAGVAKSLTQTMFGPEPTKEETAALVAFLDTLTPPPNPNRKPDGSLTLPAERGKKLFHGQAGCVRCHRGTFYTSAGLYDVGLEPDGSPYKLWNPPSLLALHQRGPYLHDGRARSLDELLQTHHTPAMLGGKKLTAQERLDLIAFLLSL
jgi:cytochrome c peroxidase